MTFLAFGDGVVCVGGNMVCAFSGCDVYNDDCPIFVHANSIAFNRIPAMVSIYMQPFWGTF